jgi:hypothetical protein
MNEHKNKLIGIPYEDIVEFFKAHPAIWYTIQRMMKDASAC